MSRICVNLQTKGRKYPPNDPRCETDVGLVKIFTQDEWNKLHARMHAEELQAKEREKIRQAREEMKEKSKEMYKDWTNTYLGARAKKLADREKRLAKEEAERVEKDKEEARYQAEQRRKKLCEARTMQYYESERVRRFHEALHLTEVLKERDLQMQLKAMQEEYEKSKGDEGYKEFLRKLDEAIKLEKEAAARARQATMESKNFVLTQIEDHKKQKAAEREAEFAEGRKIRQLALEAEEEMGRQGLQRKREMQDLNKILLESISDHQKMKTIEKIRDEEFDEDIRIYAAAKRKMTIMRMDKERSLFLAKSDMQRKAVELLEKQIRLQADDEDERIARAIKEREARFEAEEAAKKEKEEKGIREVLEHLHIVLKEKAAARDEEEKQAVEDLKRRIADAEALVKEEAEKKAKSRAICKELADDYLQKAEEHKANRKSEREAEIKWAREGDEDAQMEDAAFLDYANRLINTCEKNGRNTYPMRKEILWGKGLGMGMNLPGMGRMRTSAADNDPDCQTLPDFIPGKEHVEL
nr:unnamed protein product [Spirometra erinaceieuropaei]